MNIVLDCERMKYPNTGLYTFCRLFSQAMQDTIAINDQLSLYIRPQTGRFLGDDVSYIKYNLMNKILPVPAPKADIWHTTYQLSKYRGGNKKTKQILTVHDLNYLYEKTTPSKISKYKIEHQKRIDRADYIVAISEFAKKDILEQLDVKDKPVYTIHNGCTVLEFPGFETTLYRPSVPYILAIGTIVRKKNFHVLPALLVGNDYELIIAGIMTDYVDQIIDQAKLHNVENRVKILGAISDQDKYWYLKNCMAFAFPSLAEGFGMPILEAMHFGKPVFTSTSTSLPEIGGNAAYYFHDFDPQSMQKVFVEGMNDYLNNNRSETIIKHRNIFNWHKCAEEYYEIYKQVLGQ